jgi:glyoxalase family protein
MWRLQCIHPTKRKESIMQLTGIHHLTAVTADVRENHRFYTRVLGMRLVKRSVNQDDVSAYHLFYADAAGSPGTDLTFFDWSMPREQRGTHSITRTHCASTDTGAELVGDHLQSQGVKTNGVTERDGAAHWISKTPRASALPHRRWWRGRRGQPWEQSTVPSEYQIRGLGPIMMSVPDLRRTDPVLTQAMNLRHVREYSHPENAQHTVHVYEMGTGGPHAELHVAVQPGLPFAQLGRRWRASRRVSHAR